jgi:magnesium-protoporphyrin O-methyltransferase
MATTPGQLASFYNEKRAAADLRQYREQGPNPWTKVLIDALKAEGVAGATLLDIGGGIGAIQHELLAAGVVHVMSVEASPASLAAAREESERRGYADRVEHRLGDFVELAASIPPAEIVTLDRVVNVYPDWERLLRLSTERARRLYGLVVPRDTRLLRLGSAAVRGIFRQSVHADIRPVAEIDRIVREQGLRPVLAQDVGRTWQVAVYHRP